MIVVDVRINTENEDGHAGRTVKEALQINYGVAKVKVKVDSHLLL